MNLSWLATSWSSILMVAISAIGIYISLILLTRIAGLRSFSKMSSFDFAVTVAIGSVVATTILSKNPPLVQAGFALAMLYIIQMSVARLRGISTIFSKIIDNQPLLLMKGSKILEENLKVASVTHSDLSAKLREANVTQMNQIKAVVMEATGDISVLHNENPSHQIDDEIMKEVKGWSE